MGVSATGVRLAALDTLRQNAEQRLMRQVDQLSAAIEIRDQAERQIASHLGDVLATHQHIAETITQMHNLVHRSTP